MNVKADRRQRCWSVLLVALLAFGAWTATAGSAQGYNGGNQQATGPGFDTCAAPTSAVMNTWWTYSPYYYIGIYIGGSLRACSQPNLTKSWVDYQNSTNWGFIPTWVGPQAPCTSYSSKFSSSTATARTQGQQEAAKAVSAQTALGFLASNVIYYDLEGFDTTNSACVAAAKAFIDGWVTGLGSGIAGLYGSSCASALSQYATIAHVPDGVWAANYNGNKSVYGLSCLSNTLWRSHQRVHQYTNTHTEQYPPTTGPKLSIDNDCADGWISDRISLQVAC